MNYPEAHICDFINLMGPSYLLRRVQRLRSEKAKIILSFFQVFSAFRSTYDLSWPIAVQRYMQRWAAFSSMDLMQVLLSLCLFC